MGASASIGKWGRMAIVFIKAIQFVKNSTQDQRELWFWFSGESQLTPSSLGGGDIWPRSGVSSVTGRGTTEMVAELIIRMGCVQPVRNTDLFPFFVVVSWAKAISIALAVPVAIVINGVVCTGSFVLRKIPVQRTSP